MVIRNKWILIRDAFKYSEFKNCINDKKMNAVVGFLYVDHECGLSLQIDGYFTDRAYIKIKDTLLVFRHSAFFSFVIEDLSKPQQEIINLPDIPQWLSIYEDEELNKIRNDNTLDLYRHPAFPDDVKVLLFQKNKNPELIWFRIKKKLPDGYQATLLNSPVYGGLKKGDSLVINYARIRNTIHLIVVVD